MKINKKEAGISRFFLKKVTFPVGVHVWKVMDLGMENFSSRR